MGSAEVFLPFYSDVLTFIGKWDMLQLLHLVSCATVCAYNCEDACCQIVPLKHPERPRRVPRILLLLFMALCQQDTACWRAVFRRRWRGEEQVW
jgi:hypothetical protein